MAACGRGVLLGGAMLTKREGILSRSAWSSPLGRDVLRPSPGMAPRCRRRSGRSGARAALAGVVHPRRIFRPTLLKPDTLACSTISTAPGRRSTRRSDLLRLRPLAARAHPRDRRGGRSRFWRAPGRGRLRLRFPRSSLVGSAWTFWSNPSLEVGNEQGPRQSCGRDAGSRASCPDAVLLELAWRAGAPLLETEAESRFESDASNGCDRAIVVAGRRRLPGDHARRRRCEFPEDDGLYRGSDRGSAGARRVWLSRHLSGRDCPP